MKRQRDDDGTDDAGTADEKRFRPDPASDDVPVKAEGDSVRVKREPGERYGHDGYRDGDDDDDEDDEDDAAEEAFAASRRERGKTRPCPYLGTVDRMMLDFDFEKVCTVTLQNANVYACLVCGKVRWGQALSSMLYATIALCVIHQAPVSHQSCQPPQTITNSVHPSINTLLTANQQYRSSIMSITDFPLFLLQPNRSY